MAIARFYLTIPHDKLDYALRHGAQLEKKTNRYYVDGDIPEVLEAFTTERPEKIPLKQPGRVPICPTCRSRMVERQGKDSGQLFWGCSRYPKCRKTLPMSQVTWNSTSEFTPAYLDTTHPQLATMADYTRVATKALKILGPDKFEAWLFSPLELLGNIRPAELLKTKSGVELVEILLEHWNVR